MNASDESSVAQNGYGTADGAVADFVFLGQGTLSRHPAGQLSARDPLGEQSGYLHIGEFCGLRIYHDDHSKAALTCLNSLVAPKCCIVLLPACDEK